MNRLGNCHNPYQGSMKKILCICSAGLLRSPTIAWVLSNPPYNCNTRAAGVTVEYALIYADDVLIDWADAIIAAEDWHLSSVDTRGKPTLSLNLPDQFSCRAPELIELIRTRLADHRDFIG